jgi:uncharacterized protein YycO
MHMLNIVFRTEKTDWAAAGLAKKSLAWHLKNNVNGIFDEAIKMETDLLWSFFKDDCGLAA